MGTTRDKRRRGRTLGGYELIELIGSGGNGDVYRARSVAQQRDVALKVLRAAVPDAHDLHRFRHEARTLTLLSHPNIVVVHDVGTHDGVPYIATELLEGETLRERLKRGTLSPKAATTLAIQVADGLAAAHRHEVVHRDLKPENLFLTGADRIKILDFGLAKCSGGAGTDETRSSTVTPTAPGVVVGTLNYMSPEQIGGDGHVDHRADIFSLGVILYEMLTALRPFQRDSPAETVAAVLHAQPPDLLALRRDVPETLEAIIEDCLRKAPEQRFDSARDVALALRGVLRGIERTEAASLPPPAPAPAAVTPAPSNAVVAPPPAPARRRPRWRAFVLASMTIALVFAAGPAIWSARGQRGDTARFTRVAFGRGPIFSARFAPDGRIVYEAALNGRAPELYTTVPGTVESRALGLPDAAILSVSSTSEMAFSMHRRAVGGYLREGSLYVGPVEGRAPRKLLDAVYWAAWRPHSGELIVVRQAGARTRLEILGGRALYETGGWLGEPRFSPDGQTIVVVDHPRLATSAGSIVLIGLDGRSRVLSAGWSQALGVVWAPGGHAVCVTGILGDAPALYAVDLQGRARVVRRATGTLTLYDVAPDGRLLLTRDDDRLEAWGRLPGDPRERNLSWLDWTMPRDLSADSSLLLFTEAGEATAFDTDVYVRNLATSEVTRLGPGSAQALSPDSRLVLTLVDGQLALERTGASGATLLGRDGIAHHPWSGFFPDGQRIVFAGSEPQRGSRVYVQRIPAGRPAPISPEGFRLSSADSVSPDGRMVAVIGPDERVYLCPAQGGEPGLLPGSRPGELVAGWDRKGDGVLVFTPSQLPVTIYRLTASGGRQFWRALEPEDPTGAVMVHRVVLAHDGVGYVYTLERMLSDLYVATGLL